jgi:hypothetical protein
MDWSRKVNSTGKMTTEQHWRSQADWKAGHEERTNLKAEVPGMFEIVERGQ